MRRRGGQNFEITLHQRAFLMNYTMGLGVVNNEQRARSARQQHRWTLRHPLRMVLWEVKLFVFVIGNLRSANSNDGGKL